MAKFRAIGIDTSGIGLHSLRIGGASAALNSGVPDHVTAGGNLTLPRIYIAVKISDDSFLLLGA